MVSALLLLAGVIGYAYGEMCLLLPYQRGGLVPDDQLNMEGAPACNIRNTYGNGTDPGKPPCYGRSNDDERIDQFIGNHATQVFIAQKNKDMYNKANPGNFTFNLWKWNGDADMTFIKTLNATNDTNSTKEFYQVTAEIPTVDSEEHYVIQAIYYTNTKQNGTDINFYQCADVLAI